MNRAVALLAIAAVVLLGLVVGYRNAVAAPVVRYLTIRTPDYPEGLAPVRVALVSDMHVHGPDMPPARLGAIVEQINALHPDLDILAGDFVGGSWVGAHYSPAQAIAPLRGLKARLGVYAVLGNHDYNVGGDAVARALADAGVHVLVNQATPAGPIALGGIDGDIRVRRAVWLERRKRTYAALERIGGVKLVVAHRPDEFESAPPWIDLMVAGHTHCGQIALPLIGPLETGSDFGRKYLCGVIRNGRKLLVVTAGVGTSHLPLRIGAPADLWLIRIERG